MGDAVNGYNLPSGLDLYAGYIDGEYADWTLIASRFGAGISLKITAIPGSQWALEADVCDCETGDYTPQQAAAWALARLRGHNVARIYSSRSTWPQVVRFLGTLDTEVLWWAATLDGTTAVPGAAAVQFTNHGNLWDESVISDVRWWPAANPPAPAPPSQPGKDPDMILVRNTATGEVATFNGAQKVHLADQAAVSAFQTAGLALVELDANSYTAIPDAT
jgi:hypothetical protein